MGMMRQHTGVFKHLLQLSLVNVLVITNFVQVWGNRDIGRQEQYIVN